MIEHCETSHHYSVSYLTSGRRSVIKIDSRRRAVREAQNCSNCSLDEESPTLKNLSVCVYLVLPDVHYGYKAQSRLVDHRKFIHARFGQLMASS